MKNLKSKVYLLLLILLGLNKTQAQVSDELVSLYYIEYSAYEPDLLDSIKRLSQTSCSKGEVIFYIANGHDYFVYGCPFSGVAQELSKGILKTPVLKGDKAKIIEYLLNYEGLSKVKTLNVYTFFTPEFSKSSEYNVLFGKGLRDDLEFVLQRSININFNPPTLK